MGIFYKPLLLCLSLTVLIQAAEPPTGVDAALRSRIEEFYQLQIARKFRQSEQFVAEDTKDYYYGSQKPDLKGIKITSIKYGPDFKTAQVSVTLQRIVLMMGAGPQLMAFPITTTWKIEDGKWCWTVDQSALLDTPFGRFHPGPDTSKGDAASIAAKFSAIGSMNGVQADRGQIQFDLGHPQSQTLTLKNTMPGPVTIETVTNSPGLKIEIAKPNLGADESTQVTITPIAGRSERPEEVIFKVGPLGQIIRIALTYKLPQ